MIDGLGQWAQQGLGYAVGQLRLGKRYKTRSEIEAPKGD
jgi:hypothetical protein